MSSKLGRLLLLCDQALIDMRHLTVKVTTLEQCYVGEGVHDQAGTADLSDMEVGLIQQVKHNSDAVELCSFTGVRPQRSLYGRISGCMRFAVGTYACGHLRAHLCVLLIAYNTAAFMLS